MFPVSPVSFAGPIPCGLLRAQGRLWSVTVVAATRDICEWVFYLEVTGGGARHEFRVRVHADASHAVTAQRVIEAVRRWLATPALERPELVNLLD